MKKTNKHIVEEILSVAPELKGDKSKLVSAIKMLQSISPNIKADPAFKKDLRMRLTGLEYFQKEDSGIKKWFTFLVPVMSIGFVIFGLFIFFEDTQQSGPPSSVQDEMQSFSQLGDQHDDLKQEVDMIFDNLEEYVDDTQAEMVPQMRTFKDVPSGENETNEIIQESMPMIQSMMMDVMIESELSLWDQEIQKFLEQGCETIQIDIDGNTCSLEDGRYNVCTEMLTTQMLDVPICVDQNEKKK